MADDELPPPPMDDLLPPPPPDEDDLPPPPPPDAGNFPSPPGGDAVKLPKAPEIRVVYKGPKSHPPPTYVEDGEHPSAINEYVSSILDMWVNSPFHGRDLATTSPDQMVISVENTFYSPQSLKRAMSYHPMTGDVVIASPPRCGQSAVLSIVDQLLLYTQGADEEHMSNRIPWIESTAFDNIPPPPSVDGRRVFKTHLSLGSLKTYMKPGVKYITVLRHPVDLRLSFFRHMRKIHIVAKDAESTQFFDDFYSLDDFVKVPIGPFGAVQSGVHSRPNAANPQDKVAAALFESPDAHVYEHEVVHWIKEERANPKQILIVFYEDLCLHPEKVALKIANFVDAKKPDFPRVLDFLRGWEFPQHIVDEVKAAQILRQAQANAVATNNRRAAESISGKEKTVVHVPPKPPSVPKPESKLPSGWKSAKDKSGERYYYNRTLDLSQWNIPTLDQATGDAGDTGLLLLSCMNRGVKQFDEESVNYLDQVWDYCVTSTINAAPDSYETLYLQQTGEPYPFGSRNIKIKAKDGKAKGKKN